MTSTLLSPVRNNTSAALLRRRWLLALAALLLPMSACSGDFDTGGGAVADLDPLAAGGIGGLIHTTPAPLCVADGVMRHFPDAIQCPYGGCDYSIHYTDTPCDDCCQGAEVNPTGNPIGGGANYSATISMADATAVVNTLSALTAALGSASDGEVIFVAGNAQIDVTGHAILEIPMGVTLASDRGVAGSAGALLFTDEFAARKPIFRTAGADVRITGLRLRGPSPHVGDHRDETNRGIDSAHQGLEIDNCELSEFLHGAVVLKPGAEAYVHHNHIHHNARIGLGYGISLNSSEALIEANLFDFNRHSIAATGRPGTSYEARYNVVLNHAASHYFDMHGAVDFEKGDLSALWRFDENGGSTIADSSLFHDNDCSPVNMDMSDSWRDGHTNSALQFDGEDDYLSCGNDPSLQSAEGSISFWFQTKTFDENMDLVNLFQDSWENYLLIRRDNSNKIYLRIEKDNVGLVNLKTNITVTDLGFHHVAVTQDGNGAKIYIDGQQVSTSGDNASDWSNHLTLSDMWLGGGHWTNFNGVLDEVRVYSKALSAADVLRHYEGHADIAGESMIIHHNTFRGADKPAVVVRGIPRVVGDIHHNWFADTDPAHAVIQRHAYGNLDIESNHYGSTAPLGIKQPNASFATYPEFGDSTVAVLVDASASTPPPFGQLNSYRWNFGDGAIRVGPQSIYLFGAAGRFNIELLLQDDRGVPSLAYRTLTRTPQGGGQYLDFWVNDSYSAELTNFYVKQALIDGVVVWQDDVAGNEGWQHVSVDVSQWLTGKTEATVAFRVENLTAIDDFEGSDPIELSMYIDDVTLFGGNLQNGAFENSAAGWTHSGDSHWSRGRNVEEVRSGLAAYRLHYPYKKAIMGGSSAQVEQVVSLK